MVCENCDAERSVTRVHNRALRRVNKLLRRKEQDLRGHADEMFTALCETNHSAEQAMREIWERAGLQEVCNPDDYEFIVETVVGACNKAGLTAPASGYCDPAAAE